MRRKGNVASALFSAICTAGVLTLFSQVNLTPTASSAAGGGSTTSLNPGDTPSKDFGGLMPAALKEGAVLQVTREKKAVNSNGRLRLR